MLAVVFCAYANSFKVPFQFDDYHGIYQNRSVHFTEFSSSEVQEFIRGNRNFLRIFAFSTFALNYYFGGFNVFGYHLVNLLVHLGSGLFLYWFLLLTFHTPTLKKWNGPKAFPIALFSALLFLSHPIQTQSVTYICQRMASMGGMFYLLAMVLYVKGRLSSSSRRFLYWAGLGLSYLLGVFTKENVAILPIFVALYEFYFFQDFHLTPKRKKAWICAFGIVMLIALLGFFFWGRGGLYKLILEGYKGMDFTLTERVLTQFRVVLYYVSLLIYPGPSRLNLDHDFATSRSLFDPWTTVVSILVVAGLIGYSLWVARRKPVLSYFVLWYFGNLLIESSIFPLEMIYEHRLYLPSVGPVVLFVVGVLKGWERLRERWRVLERHQWPPLAFFCCLTFLFIVGCYERNLVWRDEISLWQDAVAKSPAESRPYCNLGMAYSHVGRYEEAIGLFKQAIRLQPDSVDAYNNLGAAYMDTNRPDQAVQALEKAISIKPNHPEAYYNLGRIYLINGTGGSRAISLFKKAIELKPDYADAYVNLAAAYNQVGGFEESVRLLERGKAFITDGADFRLNLGVAYAGIGDTTAASKQLERLWQLNPQMAQQLKDFMGRSQKK